MAAVQPRTVDWIGTAPIRIREQVTIAASPDAVWAEIADNESWPEWFPGFKSCSFESAPPHGVGSVRNVHQDAFRVAERIVAWEPGARWAMTVVTINVPVLASMAEELVLEATSDGGCEIDWRIGAQTTPLARPLRPLLVRNAARGLAGAVANLAARLT